MAPLAVVTMSPGGGTPAQPGGVPPLSQPVYSWGHSLLEAEVWADVEAQLDAQEELGLPESFLEEGSQGRS